MLVFQSAKSEGRASHIPLTPPIERAVKRREIGRLVLKWPSISSEGTRLNEGPSMPSCRRCKGFGSCDISEYLFIGIISPTIKRLIDGYGTHVILQRNVITL